MGTVRDRGLEILGINNDEDLDAAKKLVAVRGVTWPQATLDSIKDRLKVNAFPTTILLDPDGKIISMGPENEHDRRHQAISDRLREQENADTGRRIREKCLRCHLLFWAGTNSQVDQPFSDRGADDLRVILLQVVKAGGKLHNSAVLEALRKVLSEGRRYQSAWISHEKQLWVKRLRQSTMRFLYG